MESLPDTDFDVLIVGAGPAGLGIAVALQICGVKRMAVLETKTVGASFEQWPKQMRLITPSFFSNPFKQVDLNAITPETSPGDFLRSEHPSGPEYAAYLRSVVGHYRLPVRSRTKVVEILPDQQVFPGEGGRRFVVKTNHDTLTARYIVWAAGEFAYPLNDDFKGADLCLHNTLVGDWAHLKGEEFAVIGSGESGMDAAIHLLRRGKTVHLMSRGEPIRKDSVDPSLALSPHTRDQLRSALESHRERLQVHSHADITEVRKSGGNWSIIDKNGVPFSIATQPILATGFVGSLVKIVHLFELSEGKPVFSEEADESTITPGLFYSGPLLEHRGSKFCFIYKFRSRFGVVAREIAKRLELDLLPLAPYESSGFMNEDLECATDCSCAIPSEAAAPDARSRRYAEAAASRQASLAT